MMKKSPLQPHLASPPINRYQIKQQLISNLSQILAAMPQNKRRQSNSLKLKKKKKRSSKRQQARDINSS